MSETSDVAERGRVAEWIDRLYKPERLNALDGRRERIIDDRLSDLASRGHALISHHDAVTGKQEWLVRDGHDTGCYCRRLAGASAKAVAR